MSQNKDTKKVTVNLTRSFIRKLNQLMERPLPEPIRHLAKRVFLDYLGVSFAGAQIYQEKERNFDFWTQGSEGKHLVLGLGKNVSLERSALINGMISHVAELDDGVNSGIVHPATPVFSALLPLAQQLKSTSEDFLKAAMAGYETVIRLADAIQPAHKKLGYHASGTCGTVGAAVACAFLLDLGEEETVQAFASAAISASGMLKAIEDASELKPYNVGRAALNGLNSAILAKEGFQGPEDVLEGERGFLNLMSGGKFSTLPLVNFPKSIYSISRAYIKPYAACRYCHPAIEASIALHQKNPEAWSSILSVEVETYDLAVKKHDHVDIDGISSAKMSIPYSVAVALVKGTAGIKDFSLEDIQNPDINQLTKKVHVRENAKMSQAFPQKSPASVVLAFDNGANTSAYVEDPYGEPENPLSDQGLFQKYEELMAFAGVEKEGIQKLAKLVWAWPMDLASIFRAIEELGENRA